MRVGGVQLIALAALILAFSSAEAQQFSKVPKIGLLGAQSASQSSERLAAFRLGLAEHGYIVGQNIIVEERWADGHFDRLDKLVEDLVRLNVDVVLAIGGTPSIRAAKNATSTIPIVFAGLGSDPVELGLVKSFARPGGNVTGVGSGGPELYEKRLELLKETVPTLSLVAYLRNPDNPAARLTEAAIRGSARLLRVQLLPLDVRSPSDLGSAFENATRSKASGLIAAASPPITTQVKQVVDLALQHRMPAMFPDPNFPPAGGLMSYSGSSNDVYRRAANRVDRILKGANPAELPVEQPTKFELVINLKTAKQIGLTIPPNVLARADRVIK